MVAGGFVAAGLVDGMAGIVGVKRVVISTVGKSGTVDLVGVDMVADVTEIIKYFTLF